MSRFFSTFEKQIDAKGRISVPAPYRAAVTGAGGDRIYCFPSFVDQAIECYAPAAYMALLDRIESIVESPEAREQLELAVITRGVELAFDGEGRVTFPERMLKLVGIEKAVLFAGRGNRFQIWEPGAFAKTEEEAKVGAAPYRHLLLNPVSPPKAEAAS